MTNSKGIIYFAFNNEKIDYWYLASLSAITAKHNLNVPVCLVTKSSLHDISIERHGQNYADSVFDIVKFVPEEQEFIDNKKSHSDGRWKQETLPYKNSMQVECYNYSPFDETILLDTDYLVLSNNLSNCWNSELDLMVNYYTNNIGDGKGYRKTPINNRGMSVLWSTCMYFRKSAYMDGFFELVSYIKKHWQYYYSLYGIKSRLYRNDYVFSIAHHIIHGYVDASHRDSLPINGMFVLEDYNDVYDMPDKNELTLLSEIPKEKGNYIPSRLSEIDVHVKNKWAITRIGERMKKLYGY